MPVYMTCVIHIHTTRNELGSKEAESELLNVMNLARRVSLKAGMFIWKRNSFNPFACNVVALRDSLV